MKQIKKNDVVDISQLPPSEALEAQRIQREYEERTVWRKDIIWTWTKAISITSISISCSLTLFFIVFFRQNADLLEKIIEIVACVLSFLAGRSTRR